MKIVSTLIVLLAAILQPGIFGWAQDSSAIQAKLVDSKTNLPVPFATIRVMQSESLIGGVISNEDGGFQIPIKYHTPDYTLFITCIGYSNRTLAIGELLKNELNIIKITISTTLLEEVVINAHGRDILTAYKMVKLAIKNIPKNYSLHPFSYIAYYRDYQLEEKEYVNLNEAIVEIFDKGFNAIDYSTARIKLYQYRTNNSFKTDSVTSLAYDNLGGKFIPGTITSYFGGNELSILRMHDAIRNNTVASYSFVDVFSSDFVRNHTFQLIESVYLDNASLYHISFKARPSITGSEHVAKGEIFIEHGNFAIHKLAYSTYVKDQDKLNLLYDIRVEYARFDSLMYLNYISFNNSFLSNTWEGFRVLDVVFDRNINAFIFTFNHTPERESALNRDNYYLIFRGLQLKIKKIEMSESSDKKVEVHLENDRLNSVFGNMSSLHPEVKTMCKDIWDEDGNVVNRIKYKIVNQFRELFQQKLTQKKIDETDNGSFISRQRPLRQNYFDSTKLKSSNYWMNTPLKQ